MLRSMRYGEADRILHLYTPDRGRVSAIAKGVRRARSRFGGRLEPFFRLHIELHEGRSELLTVTGAQTVDGHSRLRGDARALDAAARACDAVGRLFETSEPHPGVFNLLCRKLSLLDEQAAGSRPRADRPRCDACVSPQAAARRGPRPAARCVCFLWRARASRGLLRSRRAESSAERARRRRFRSDEQAYRFMAEALGSSAGGGARGARAGALRRWSVRFRRRSSIMRTCG